MKGWHRRYVVLFKGKLQYGKSQHSMQQKGRVHDTIELGTAMYTIQETIKKINIDSSKGVFHFKTSDQQLFTKFVQSLEQHVQYAKSVKFQNFKPQDKRVKDSIEEELTGIQKVQEVLAKSIQISDYLSQKASKFNSLSQQSATYLELHCNRKPSRPKWRKSKRSSKKSFAPLERHNSFTNLAQNLHPNDGVDLEPSESFTSVYKQEDDDGEFDTDGLTPLQVADELIDHSNEIQHNINQLKNGLTQIQDLVKNLEQMSKSASFDRNRYRNELKTNYLFEKCVSLVSPIDDTRNHRIGKQIAT